MRIVYYALFACFLLSATSAFAQCDSVNYALGRPASASSIQGGNTGVGPNFAFDGDTVNSRWSSEFSDPQYLYVDLGNAYNLCMVRIFWEAAYATTFNIEGTNDTTAGWTTLATITGNTSQLNNIAVSGNYRFVRMLGLARATPFGYSIYEMQVYGQPIVCNPTNIGLNQVVGASSTQGGAGNIFDPPNVNDGDLNTRWVADPTDDQSITINLGAIYPLCRTTLYWNQEHFPVNFSIDYSTDSVTFTTDTTILNNSVNYNVINLHGNAQYIRMHGTLRNQPASGYSLTEWQVYASGPGMTLPVKLTSFTATPDNDQHVLLNWSTVQETNDQYFSVERSTDGVHYTAIGRVPGAGNSNSPLYYQWADDQPLTGLNFYRLNQVDLDGHSTYSSVVTARINGGKGALSLYPNPAKEMVNIVNPDGRLIRQIRVFNTAGIEVKRFEPLVNNTTIQLPIGELSSGIYTLKVVTDNGTEVLKVIK